MSANPKSCLDGECEYSKAVSMHEYRCVGKCQYSDTDANHAHRPKGRCVMPYEDVIRSVVDNWYGDMMWGDRSNDITWIDKMVRELSAAVEANGGENTRADTAELLFEGLEKDYQKVVAAFDEQRTLARNLRKSLIGYMAAVETGGIGMTTLVEPIMDLIEERLAIIWARPGSREFFAGELRNIVQLRREIHWKRDCQYLLDILDDLRSFDDLSEEDENAIAGIRARLGGYSPEELS